MRQYDADRPASAWPRASRCRPPFFASFAAYCLLYHTIFFFTMIHCLHCTCTGMPSSKRTKKISLTKVCGGAARRASVR